MGQIRREKWEKMSLESDIKAVQACVWWQWKWKQPTKFVILCECGERTKSK